MTEALTRAGFTERAARAAATGRGNAVVRNWTAIARQTCCLGGTARTLEDVPFIKWGEPYVPGR
jgi:hypothetical protein